MIDNPLDDILRQWSNEKKPNEKKRTEILKRLFEPQAEPQAEPATVNPRKKTFQKIPLVTLVSCLVILAVMSVCVISTFFERPEKPERAPERIVVQDEMRHENSSPIRVSLMVLRRLPDSEFETEFLEDTVLVTEDQEVQEFTFDGHHFVLWVYRIETDLFTFDISIDKAAETGLVTIADRPQAMLMKSDGEVFEVFMSVLPNS